LPQNIGWNGPNFKADKGQERFVSVPPMRGHVPKGPARFILCLGSADSDVVQRSVVKLRQGAPLPPGRVRQRKARENAPGTNTMRGSGVGCAVRGHCCHPF